MCEHPSRGFLSVDRARNSPTQGTLGGIHCGNDIYTVPAGGVVVTLTTWQGPPHVPATAPPTAIRLESGVAATVIDTRTTSIWELYVPDWLTPLKIEAHFDEIGAEEIRGAGQGPRGKPASESGPERLTSGARSQRGV
jgi:hypothetical protein